MTDEYKFSDQITAKDVMRKAIPNIKTNVSIKEVLNIFRKHKINILPVVEQKKIIGEIHKMDLLKIMVNPNDLESDQLIQMHYKVDFAYFAKTAKDLMTLHSVFVKANDNVQKVAAKMLENGVRSALVKEKNKVVGIVTINTLIKKLLENKK